MGPGFDWLRALSPFGEGNPAPTFLARDLEVREVRPLGNSGQHLKLKLRENRVSFDAAAFRLAQRWTDGADRIDAVYRLETEWRGGAEVVSLRLLDFRPATGTSAS
jgi:single-stranded-DNA-specific exonuclease